VDLRFFFPSPNRASRPEKPAFTQQQKQIKRRITMRARTPMTIPAIAPALKPPDVDLLTVGSMLPLAVAAGRKGTVVDADTVVVETVPLVGRSGAPKELVGDAVTMLV